MNHPQRPVVTPLSRRDRVNRAAVAVAAAGVTLAGLFVSGPVGGVLLVLVAAALVALSVRVWPVLTVRQQVTRVAVLALVVVVAVLKLTGSL